MELSDPAAPSSSPATDDATNRRRSGRVKQQPVLYQQDPSIFQSTSSGEKRKRPALGDGDVDGQDNDSEEESGPDRSESGPDGEEFKERRKRARKAKKFSSRPVVKRPKTATTMTTKLAVRPAMNGFKKPAKPKKSRARPSTAALDEDGGLYGKYMKVSLVETDLLTRLPAEVFSDIHTLDAVAANWITRYEEHNANAVCDLINFVLRCCGCHLQIDVHDVEDPDNATSRLEDLQNEFHAQNVTDYPLVSRTKSNATFKSTMTGFFHSLIRTAHAAGLLYSDEALLENIEVWVTTMSDSSIRPFRHTATVIALTIGSTICGLIADIADNTAKLTKQKEGEQKKKSVNKERVKGLEVKIREGDAKRDAAQKAAEGLFDTVYAHRYRDVDPKIRADCVSAFGTWITACPEVFFSGQYIRYLGWVLSDTAAPTRAEAVKQLSKLYRNKEDVGRLRAFTERFRPRLVEMAIRDAEPTIRAATVELLGMVRETGLLEPDDIDNIGRLVFDSEPRVRKAVAGFFAENINDLFESVIEDLGGDETVDEALGEEVEDDYESPKKSWLKFKCLAESLEGYDAEEDTTPAAQQLTASGEDSRLTLAAQTVYDGIEEVEKWEFLAGYLLYDLSNVDASTTDPEAAFKARCQLSEKEDVLLLEILHVAVKSRLLKAIKGETDSKGKTGKARKQESRQIQEAIALHLAQVIPRLLKKFGANPATATAVLRLGQVLDLEIFQELRQDSTTYASLLDDINKQFLTHADSGVLIEASTALLHARNFEDLEEVTESKVQELWDDTINTLVTISTAQANLADSLTELRNTVRRVQNLASISDCVSQFESRPRATKKSPKTDNLLSILLNLMQEFTDQSDLDAESIEAANDLIITSTKAVLFYYMWLVRSLRATVEEGKQVTSLPSFDPIAQTLLSIMESRSLAETVRLAATGAYLDLHTLFATFRHLKPSQSADGVSQTHLTIQRIPVSVHPLLTTIFASAEKSFAKKSHRTLEPAPDDAPDVDSDPEDLPSEDEDDDEETQQKRTAVLLAEKSLCELTSKMVLAIVGRVLDSEGKDKSRLKERLLWNKAKLGPNYKEVVAHLDPPKQKRKPVKKVVAKKELVREEEEEVESIEDDEEEGRQVEEGGEEDLRERELVDDRIDDRSDDEAEGGGAGRTNGEDAEDQIMGD